MILRFSSPSTALLLLLATPVLADHGKGAIGGKTISPRTLHEGDASLELGVRLQEAEAIPTDQFVQDALRGHDVHNVDWFLEYSVAVSYGVTDRLTLSAGVPFSVLHNFKAGGVDNTGAFVEEDANNVTGLGDATLTAKYSLFSDPVELAVIVGIKAPTGNTTEKLNSGDLLEPNHQPGSGSWDPLVGFAAARALTDRILVGMSALWRLTTEGRNQHFTPGNIFQNSYRFEYQISGLGSFPRWYGSVELVAAYFDRDKQYSQVNRDTGGFLLELGPGLKTRVDPHLSLGGSVYVPLYQNLFGTQHKELYEVLIGLVYDF